MNNINRDKRGSQRHYYSTELNPYRHITCHIASENFIAIILCSNSPFKCSLQLTRQKKKKKEGKKHSKALRTSEGAKQIYTERFP